MTDQQAAPMREDVTQADRKSRLPEPNVSYADHSYPAYNAAAMLRFAAAEVELALALALAHTARPDAGDDVERAIAGIADDFMTSEEHHPGYVLIPTAKFEQLRAASEQLA